MDIVCATDNRYVMPTGVMLTSLFENNRGEDIRVHVLHGGIDSTRRDLLADIAARYGHDMVFYKIDDALTSAYPIGLDGQNPHVGTSHATYYRLVLADVLPASVGRVIYLDGDTLVLGRLDELWTMDMQGKAIAAVPDSYNNRVEHYNRLRYPQADGYFNAGVLLIDLAYWRGHGLLALFADYARRNAGRLQCHDQDILNSVLREAKTVLPLKYNMLNEYWFDVRYSVVSWEFDGQMLDGQRHPVVVHFTGIPKPWYTNCRHPMKREFERYRAMTVWRGMTERRWMPLKYVAEHAAVRAVVALGLRAADYIVENRYVKL